jgi:hypothetical protein
MMRFAPLIGACLLFAPGLAAQTVMRPQPARDSAHAAMGDALLGLRDSLSTIDDAAARLQRDYRLASAASLLARARLMRDACARSVRAVGPTKRAVQATKVSEPPRVKRRGQLLGAMDQLSGALNRCHSEFASMSQPGQAETVRGYANDRAVRVQAAIRKYEEAMRGFLGVMGIRVTPLGVTPDRLAG